jgi:hypothetical protein
MEEPKVSPAASVEDPARRVRDAAGDAINDVKHATLQGLEDARGMAGDTGRTTAARLRDFAGQVKSDMPWMASAFTKSADGLDNVTTSLTKGDLHQCLSGVSEFAKRQPAIFLGASLALGFALSRVGKAALEQSEPDAGAPGPERVSKSDATGVFASATEI